MENKKQKFTFNSSLANKLVNDKGLRTSWLAEKCKVSQNTIRECLKGNRSPSLAVVALMAMALGCDESKLIIENKDHAA